MDTKGSESEQPKIGAKSCDHCRRRKIRCDKETPCSACVAAGLDCAVSVKRHLREPRSRVLISDQYEKKLDSMDMRLKNIEDALKQLVDFKSIPQSSYSSPDTGTSRCASPPELAGSLNANSRNTGGEYLFKMQTIDAGDFLDRAVSQGRVRELNPHIHSSIMNLRGLVKTEGQRFNSIEYDMQSPLQQSMEQLNLGQLPMPSLGLVIPLLTRVTEESEPSLFTYNLLHAGIEHFMSIYQSFIASPSTSSIADFTIVNAGLYYLFVEQNCNMTGTLTSSDLREYEVATAMCQRNLRMAIKSWPLLLPPDINNVQALVLAVTYAVDSCWPQVAWRLNSMAATLCKRGLFHRSDGAGDIGHIARIKSGLFWKVYTMDKCLSLRLGCGSVIQDWDITISMPDRESVSNGYPSDDIPLPQIWLATGTLRARVHEQIYSREALMAPSHDRIQRAIALADECQELEKEIVAAQQKAFAIMESASTSKLVKLLVMSSLVQFYALTTLVCRIIPVQVGSYGAMGSFSDRSLQYARQSIEHHLTSIKMLGTGEFLRKVYVHWTLMLTPFAPVFVLFCHVLETLNVEDLQTLERFTASMRQLSGATEVAGRIFILCQAMCDVLQACVNDAYQGNQDMGMDSAFEALSQTGFDFFGSNPDGEQPSDFTDLYFRNISLF